MALKDHYLLEDHEMLTDNLERLHKSFSKALDCATNAEFSSKDQILETVNETLTMFESLNARKEAIEMSGKVGAGEVRSKWM